MSAVNWGKPGDSVKCVRSNFSYRTCHRSDANRKSQCMSAEGPPRVGRPATWLAEGPMSLLSDQTALPVRREDLPAEVEFILSALEAGQFAGHSRRRTQRTPYRVSASLKLFSDRPDAPPWQLFVRDVNPKSLGFVT